MSIPAAPLAPGASLGPNQAPNALVRMSLPEGSSEASRRDAMQRGQMQTSNSMSGPLAQFADMTVFMASSSGLQTPAPSPSSVPFRSEQRMESGSGSSRGTAGLHSSGKIASQQGSMNQESWQ